MKRITPLLTILILSMITGCGPEMKSGLNKKDKVLFTVDFQKDKALRYKFTSNRDIEVLFVNQKSKSKTDVEKTDKYNERFEMVVKYEPIDVNPFGLTTIKATCESIKATRKGGKARGSQKDAVDTLTGKSFVFTVEPTGKIKDYSQLEELIKEAGSKAFRPRSQQGRIKEPDMVGDFIVTQWFLWDQVSTIEKPYDGVSIGQSWNSKLYIPVPMVMRKAMDVAYTLKEIQQQDENKLAVIDSTYSLSESVPKDWPIPYTGRFQMSGTFGFLRGYEILELQGSGSDIFNITTGQVEKYDHSYGMKMQATFPFGMGIKPEINVKQQISMQLLTDSQP